MTSLLGKNPSTFHVLPPQNDFCHATILNITIRLNKTDRCVFVLNQNKREVVNCILLNRLCPIDFVCNVIYFDLPDRIV